MPLSGGVNGRVNDVLRLANGELVAAGNFTQADASPALRVARWDGTAWHAMGAGLPAEVQALALFPNGDVVAGASGDPLLVHRLWRWDGVTWTPFAANPQVTAEQAFALETLDDGRLAVGGVFAQDDGFAPFRSVFFATYDLADRVQLLEQPVSLDACEGAVASLSLLASSQSAVTYQWRRDGVPIDVALNPSAATPSFTLDAVTVDDQATYDCVVTNACNTATTQSVVLTVLSPSDPSCGNCAACAADYDQNGGVDGGDLGAFFSDFEQGLPCADVDMNGGIDGGDLAAFFAAYEAGGC